MKLIAKFLNENCGRIKYNEVEKSRIIKERHIFDSYFYKL